MEWDRLEMKSNQKEVLCIIPARSGSKGLKNKNIEGIIVGKAIYDGDIKLNELAKEIDA